MPFDERITWVVGTRKFRSTIPRDREDFLWLVTATPLDWIEREVFELFMGINEIEGRAMEIHEVAAKLGIEVETAKRWLRNANRKVARRFRETKKLQRS